MKKKNLIGNAWKSLTSWLQALNMRSLFPSFSGLYSNNYINASAFIIVLIVNIGQAITKGSPIYLIVIYTVIFGSLFLMNVLIKSYWIDVLSNMILSVCIILLAPYGHLSAAVFIILAITEIKNKNQYLLIFTIVFLSTILSAWTQNLSIFQVSLFFFGFAFIGAKYYKSIYLKIKNLIKENESLKTKLSIVGDAKHLTDDQILHYYPVMAHHDYDRKYSKINMIRNFSDGMTRTKLAVKYDCSAKTIDRYLSEMKDDFGKLLNIKIAENTHLIKVCAMLDIIQVIVRQKEY